AAERSGQFEIGRILHLKSEIRNRKLDWSNLENSDFGFEMQNLSDSTISSSNSSSVSIRSLCIVFLLLLVLASCRQHMANDPRYRTFQESGFFPNGSSARPLPAGTIPQERERNAQLVNATVNAKPATDFPFPITLEVLHRGQQRFDIFCTPCHDHLGTGQG